MKSSSEIAAEIERVKQEGREVTAQITDLESRLDATKKRRSEIYGGFASWGKEDGILGDLRRELAKATLFEADNALPRVRFGGPSSWEERVVRKVTAKQIRIAMQGEEHEMICERATGKAGWGSAIHPDDLARILEGVK